MSFRESFVSVVDINGTITAIFIRLVQEIVNVIWL